MLGGSPWIYAAHHINYLCMHERARKEEDRDFLLLSWCFVFSFFLAQSDFTSSPFSPWLSQHLLALSLNPFKEIRLRKASSSSSYSASFPSSSLDDSEDENQEAGWNEGVERRGRKGSFSVTDREKERGRRQGQGRHFGGFEWEAEIIDAFDDSGQCTYTSGVCTPRCLHAKQIDTLLSPSIRERPIDRLIAREMMDRQIDR